MDPRKDAFWIYAGSYERIIFGILASWHENKLVLEPVFIFPAHTGCIKAVASGSGLLASGSTDEIIKLYDLKNRKELGTLLQHDGTITALSFFSKTHLLSAGEDGKLCIWRTKDWECLKSIKGHSGRINSLSIHPSGKLALTLGADKQLRSWDLTRGIRASALQLSKEGLSIQWSHNGEHYAVLYSNYVEIFNTSTGEIIATLQHDKKCLAIKYCFSKDAESIITGCDDGSICIWSVPQGELKAKFKAHTTRVKDVTAIEIANQDLMEPQTVIISAASDGAISCWDLQEAMGGNPQSLANWSANCRLTCISASLPN